ncbi:MAG TPA: hypothetical protein VFE98_03680 [Candidatus Bathyarchaeia archaeon]|nr:hypothetical protein [Candidatus Bathyarchaeia archaeon]
MNRVPWAPLNIGMFMIILSASMIFGYLGIAGLSIGSAVPLVFAIFGIWLIIASFLFPPADSYAPPRVMVLGWGALIMALGVLWLVEIYSINLVPVIFALLVLIAGIGIVGYSFMKSEGKKPGSTVTTS